MIVKLFTLPPGLLLMSGRISDEEEEEDSLGIRILFTGRKRGNVLKISKTIYKYKDIIKSKLGSFKNY